MRLERELRSSSTKWDETIAQPTTRKLIVYACPVGQLADQLEAYYSAAFSSCGPNAAHRYMAHCTLTGFFHDDKSAIPIYVRALDAALTRARTKQPEQVMTIQDMVLRDGFHGLLLESIWLKNLITSFAMTANSPTRQDALRPKTWLHLSLAYEFPPEQGETLAKLAKEMVDIHSPVRWELRFYEQHPDGSWTCHASWPLD